VEAGNVIMAKSTVSKFPPPSQFRHRWRTRRLEAARFGSLCRIVYVAADPSAFGAMSGVVTVEFEDGHRVSAYRGEVRRVPGR